MRPSVFQILGISLLGVSLNSCHKEHTHNVESEEVQLLNVLPEDFKTPETVWNLILDEKTEAHPGPHKAAQAGAGHGEEKADGHGKDAHGGGEHGAPAAAGQVTSAVSLDLNSVVFSAVEVILEEKNPGILKSPKIQISFPRGGGRLDLRQYLTGQTGTFFIKFEPVAIDKKSSQDTLFWSRAKKRRMGSDIYGSGCNKVLRMGPQWTALQDGRGFEVNTYKDRHLSVLGGRFFFISRKDREIFLSQIDVMDSDKKELFCDGEGQNS